MSEEQQQEMNANTAEAETETPTTNWKDSIPEVARGWDEVKNSETQDQFYGQVENLRKMIGQSIRPPSEDASAEDRQAFKSKLSERFDLMSKPDPSDPESMKAHYRTLGKPESVDGYQTPEVEGLNADQFNAYKNVALENNLTQTQFEGLVKADVAMKHQQMQAMQQNIDDSLTALKAEWGSAYEGRLNQVGNLLEQTGAPQVLKDHFARGAVDAATVKYFQSIAHSMGAEPTAMIKQGEGSSGYYTPAEAQARANEMLSNKDDAIHNKLHPDHKTRLERYAKLMAQAG